MPSRTTPKAAIPRRNTPGVQLLLQFGMDHGVSGDRCLDGTGLSWQQLADSSTVVEAEQELRLIRNLVGALGHIPGIGLRAGLRYRLATFGIWGFAMLNSATLRSAGRIAVHYLDLCYPILGIVSTVQDEKLVTILDDHRLPSDVRGFMVDRACASIVSIERDLIHTALPVLSASFRRPKPVDVRPYEELFGITPVFDAAENRIVKDASGYLDLPLPGGNPEVARQCEEQCQALLSMRRLRTGFTGQLRDRMVTVSGSSPNIEVLARELHMTSRTLRRRLEAEGTSFRQLQEEVRETLAEELLATRLTLEQMAERLGYGDVSSFIRAFKRWKRVTPHQYRSGLRQ
ncbi:putative HTH-type transcriptional regulator [Paraburkholderia hiiakae]|uniref:HTH-type transcriptional regulator n=1 Tax=Paraburkholderia hiiakae TaxID=1081782 RepID=A0ABM8PB85_9BURK|nr:AraC family transcriptional regulator [Paraburkholderia hiiakae]CAD6561569.1 putative HTH-type transcriptional regulator [Paraburkholderia hiiakae]